jgi:hypothetical protein
LREGEKMNWKGLALLFGAGFGVTACVAISALNENSALHKRSHAPQQVLRLTGDAVHELSARCYAMGERVQHAREAGAEGMMFDNLVRRARRACSASEAEVAPVLTMEAR